ncbi:MAG: cytochrome c [Thalassobaculaceae bacterium]|nr:cytochrome c [Thalassobaculaceae bacterium]
MSRSLIAVTLVLVAILAYGLQGGAVVEAHSGATGVVKERMDLMKALGGELKALAQMFKGETEFDPVVVEAKARAIEARASSAITSLFPDGSGGAPSKASAEIWSHWPEFEAKADELGTQASALAAVADAGPDAARRAFGKLAGACKSCHQDFEDD